MGLGFFLLFLDPFINVANRDKKQSKTRNLKNLNSAYRVIDRINKKQFISIGIGSKQINIGLQYFTCLYTSKTCLSNKKIRFSEKTSEKPCFLTHVLYLSAEIRRMYLFPNIVSETHNWKLLVALWPRGPYGRKQQKSGISSARRDSHTAEQMSKLSLCTSQISMTK